MLDRMYKEYPRRSPERSNNCRERFFTVDGFVFVTGEYNWGVQPGLKNLTDYFLEEWFWQPRCDRKLFGRAAKVVQPVSRRLRHNRPRWNGTSVDCTVESAPKP